MSIKTCSKCKDALPLDNFHKNASKADGRQYSCKSCSNEYSADWYRKNADVHKINTKINTFKYKQKYYEFMQKQKCVDCGETRVETLQWDHRDPSTKEFNISDGIRKGYAWGRLMSEIDKCDCRCGNCHAVKTGEQFNWYKYEERIQSLKEK